MTVNINRRLFEINTQSWIRFLFLLMCDAKFRREVFNVVMILCTRSHWFVGCCFFFFGNNDSLLVSYFGSFVTHSHSRQTRKKKCCWLFDVRFYLGVYYIRWKFYFIWTLFFFSSAVFCWLLNASFSLHAVNDMRFFFFFLLLKYFLDAINNKKE